MTTPRDFRASRSPVRAEVNAFAAWSTDTFLNEDASTAS